MIIRRMNALTAIHLPQLRKTIRRFPKDRNKNRFKPLLIRFESLENRFKWLCSSKIWFELKSVSGSKVLTAIMQLARIIADAVQWSPMESNGVRFTRSTGAL